MPAKTTTTRRKKKATARKVECPKVGKVRLQKVQKRYKKTGPKGPRLKLTDKQWEKVGALATAQCKDYHIAEIMEIDEETFRVNCKVFTRRKRAEGKAQALLTQFNMVRDKNATMAIWFGKQHLEQHDRLDIDAVVEGRPSLPIIVRLPKGADNGS